MNSTNLILIIIFLILLLLINFSLDKYVKPHFIKFTKKYVFKGDNPTARRILIVFGLTYLLLWYGFNSIK